MTKFQAIEIHWLMYHECYAQDVTPTVDKWMKQIVKGMRKLRDVDRKQIVHQVHHRWIVVQQQVLHKEDKTIVEFSELLMALHNAIPEEYKTLFYTEKTFTKVIQSFGGARNDIEESFEHTSKGRELAKAFLNEMGLEFGNSKLSRLKYTHKQNMIIEGK